MAKRALSTRIGRFQGKVGGAGGKKIPIVFGGAGQIYRVFNPRERLGGGSSQFSDFKVEFGGSNIVLKQGASADVFVTGTPSNVQIAHETGGAETLVRGMYELVGTGNDVRNGQFNFANANPNPVIDFSISNGGPAMYRFLNSGTEDLKILRNATQVTIIKPKRSVDIVVRKLQIIYVEGATSSKGIYELLYTS